jgi:hypothetical protein
VSSSTSLALRDSTGKPMMLWPSIASKSNAQNTTASHFGIEAAPPRAVLQPVVVAPPQLVEDAHLAIHDVWPAFELSQALHHLWEPASSVGAPLGAPNPHEAGGKPSFVGAGARATCVGLNQPFHDWLLSSSIYQLVGRCLISW